MNAAPVLDAQSLSKTYRRGFFGSPIHALKDLSLSVQKGEIFALLGQNGAGKTTFIKILLGIGRPTSGKAELFGYRAGDRRGRSKIGYLPENLRFARHHTANTALDLCGRLHGMAWHELRRRRQELLELVGLKGREKESVSQFSKGMMQRLGLAQALIHSPQLVFLDEPTDGLDPVARNQVRSLLLQLKAQGTTIFLNSHILQEVELVCDRVAILHQGTLRRVSTIGELKDWGALQQASLEVVVELAGVSENLRVILDGFRVRHAESPDGRRFVISLQLDAQPDLDRLIDRARGGGFSILSIHRKQNTLEDAYLRVIGATENG